MEDDARYAHRYAVHYDIRLSIYAGYSFFSILFLFYFINPFLMFFSFPSLFITSSNSYSYNSLILL